MKIIREPRVYLIGKQILDEEGIHSYIQEELQFPWQTDAPSAPEALCEIAGRTCYQSFRNPRPGGNSAYIDHIKEAQHGSVLEHAVWTFLITGVSRSLTHELVRHRHFSFSQLSQRYVDESMVDFIEPDIIANDAEVHRVWLQAIENIQEAYCQIVALLGDRIPGNGTEKKKLIRQAARSVLPNATETRICITANARALRHFLEQRGSRFAEPEIRKLANQLLKILVREAPNIFGDYRTNPLGDGTDEIVTTYRKV